MIVFLLMRLTCFTQTTLSNINSTGSDTTLQGSGIDYETVNHMFADLESCHDIADSLKSLNDTCDVLNQKNRIIISNLEASEINLQQQNTELKSEIDRISKSESKKEKIIARLKTVRNVLFIVSGLEALYIGFKELINR